MLNDINTSGLKPTGLQTDVNGLKLKAARSDIGIQRNARFSRAFEGTKRHTAAQGKAVAIDSPRRLGTVSGDIAFARSKGSIVGVCHPPFEGLAIEK